MRDPMREHGGLADAGAGDDEERRLVVLDRDALRVIEVVERGGANQGGGHGGRGTWFAFCSQAGASIPAPPH